MRTRLKAYPSYKDSGVEWLGRIPAQWEVKRLKYAVRQNPETLPETTDPDYELQYLDIGNVEEVAGVGAPQEMRFSNAPSRARRRVRSGDTIISTVRTYLKAIAYFENPPENLIVSTGFAVLRPNSEAHPKFLHTLVSASQFVEKVVARSVGVGYPAINPSELSCLPVWLPPIDEQQAIATFLDRETGKIDALVGKMERLIELLQEKRTALISHAVTQGLNPNAPQKDSGIPWLGHIPKHWVCMSVKRRTKRIQTGTTPPTSEQRYYEDGSVDWFGPGSFTDDLSLTQPVKRIAASAVVEGAARLFKAGSTMIVTIGATIGKVGYITTDASSNQQITALTFDERRMVSKFAAYQLKRFEPVLRGIAPTTTLPILDQSEIGYLPLAVPSLSEQQSIVEHLDQETAKLDALMAKVRTAMERLQEYRTALISAAVTGQVDVRSVSTL